MNDKIVTHADLPYLRGIREYVVENNVNVQPEAALLDRLIAAAEADQPPLPEGWVTRVNGAAHYHRDGRLYASADCKVQTYGPEDVAAMRRAGHLSPLRPTITEADVEKAARGFHEKGYVANWSTLHDVTRAEYLDNMRAAFAAAGIEVAK